jgi:hypothetical protein
METSNAFLLSVSAILNLQFHVSLQLFLMFSALYLHLSGLIAKDFVEIAEKM